MGPNSSAVWTLSVTEGVCLCLCLCLCLCFPRHFVCELYLSQRECVCVWTSGKSSWILAHGHNGQAWKGLGRKWIIEKEEILNPMMQSVIQRVFSSSMPKPFSGGHQTFVSDLLTCQKQHNLRTKCGIIYAEKETLDMKRDKKKKLTE